MDPAALITPAHAGATLFMTGLIWFVQVVHYPLFARVGEASFGAYHADHVPLTQRVVGVPMLVELGCALALLVWRPDAIPAWAAWLGAALAVALIASTMLVQVPLHARLAGGFDAGAHRRLVATSWLRTLGWTARGALALWMLVAGT